MNRSGITLLISAIAIALLLTWLNTSWLSYDGFQAVKKMKKIDYYLSDFTLLATQPDGKMHYHVKALHLIHQQSTGASEIFKPELIARDSDDVLIAIQAEKAQQRSKNGPIQLTKKVSIVKKSNKKSQGFQLATEDLTYNPVKNTLETKAAVMLTSNAGYMRGVGLMTKLDQQELRILSNVHAEFLPAGNE